MLLARLRPDFAPPSRPPEVHAYPLPADDNAVTLIAPCGNVLEPARSERVTAFRGAPCVPCVLSLPGLGERGISPSDPELPTGDPEPPDLLDDFGSCAVDLRGDRIRHLVPADAVRGRLEGGDVVHTTCGHLGRGPVGTAPRDWPICAECTRAAETAG